MIEYAMFLHGLVQQLRPRKKQKLAQR